MNDSHHTTPNTADELAAWTRRASAASGFGGADAAIGPLPVGFGHTDHDRLARGHRAHRLAELIVGFGGLLADAARRVWKARQRRRDAQAHWRALPDLDAHTPRDIDTTHNAVPAVGAAGTRAPLALRGLAF